VLNCSDSDYLRIKSAVPVGFLCWVVHFTANIQPWAPKSFLKTPRDKVVERPRSGDGYKNISNALNILWSTIKTIIKKWKVYRTTETLPRSGRPSKLNDQARRRLIREVTKRPNATLKELHAFMVKIGHCVNVSTISQALHKSGLYVKVASRKPLLKKPTLSPIWSMQKKHFGDSENVAKSFVVWWNKDGTFWPKCKMWRLAHNQYSTTPKEHHPYCEAWWWQHHVMEMFLIRRDWGTCQDRRENGWSKIQKNPGGKPVTLCKKEEIVTGVHLSAWQRPEPHSQSYTGVDKEQKYKCPWMTQSEPRPKSNQKSVAWLEDCCPSTLSTQLDWAWTVLCRRTDKYFPIKVCKFGRDQSKQTHNCNCC